MTAGRRRARRRGAPSPPSERRVDSRLREADRDGDRRRRPAPRAHLRPAAAPQRVGDLERRGRVRPAVPGAQPATISVNYVYDAVYRAPARRPPARPPSPPNRGRSATSAARPSPRIAGLWRSASAANTRSGPSARTTRAASVSAAGPSRSCTPTTLPAGRFISATGRCAAPMAPRRRRSSSSSPALGFDPGDGASAANAALLGARGIAVQADGTVVLADAEDQRVRRVSKTISTVAGTGDYGLSGDGGTATGAKLAGPRTWLQAAPRWSSPTRRTTASGGSPHLG